MSITPSFFDTPIERKNTDSMKWDKYADQDILPMWVADMDFNVSPAIQKALHERIDHGIYGYGIRPPEGLNALVIERMQRLYSWSIKDEHIIWIPGLVCGLNIASRSVGEGAAAMTSTPVYPPFMSAPQLSGLKTIKVLMKKITPEAPADSSYPQARWVLDLDAMEAQITDDCKLLLFCNPHNPGGTVYSREELTQIADFVIRHDLVICSDDIHCDLILEEGVKHIPIASINAEIAKRTMTLMAPSKTYNIAGLGCSFVVVEDEALRRQFKQAMEGIVPDVNLLGFTAAMAAYTDDEGWLTALLTYLRGNRDYLLAEINQIPGLKLAHFDATYLAWIDVSEAKLDNPVAFFEAAGVGLSAGADFGDAHYVRLNFGCTRALLEQAVKRIRKALEA